MNKKSGGLVLALALCGGAQARTFTSTVTESVPEAATRPVVWFVFESTTSSRGRSGTIEAPNTETQIWAFGPPGPWPPMAQSGAQKWESTLMDCSVIAEL